MQIRPIFLMLLLIAGFSIPGWSQSRKLTLQEALGLAEENNLTNKSAEAQQMAVRGSYRQTNSLFLPGLSVSQTSISTNDPLSVFGFRLKQERVKQEDFDPASLNNPDNFENYNTKIELRQPLLNVDGIYARKAMKNQYEASSFQTVFTRKNIRYEVKKAYYGLELASAAVEVFQQSKKVAEEALRMTQQNELQGMAMHSDVLEASVRLEERDNQLLKAKDQMQSANEYLAHLLGLDLSTAIELSDSLFSSPSEIKLTVTDGALANRSDMKAYQKQIEAGENMLRSEKMKFMPNINAFGSYEWNDRQVLGTSASNYMVGATLTWNLFSGYKNIGGIQHAGAQLDEARINYRNYLSQSQIQLNNARRNMELSYKQVQSSKLAREEAIESLRIRTNRFKEGLERTTDLLTSEALASQKKLEYIQSVYNYRESIFKLELLLEKDIK